jgi:UDP-2,4-diacetamido-2,4,6-trideoxy-beta-L-altropyranose hydrolase
MRCLTLAEELAARGAEVAFICRDLPGNLCEIISGKGLQVFRLPAPQTEGHAEEPAAPSQWLGISWARDREETLAILHQYRPDWLVVDHYALDAEWESAMRHEVDRIMVIDDLADRLHECDLLLDQNLYDGLERRYDGLVPNHCVKLLGPRYALLRPEFAAARKALRHRDGRVRRILIFFGGSDLSNETAKALEAIRLLNRSDIAVDVVVGASNPKGDLIRRICQGRPNSYFHLQVENMADLMSAADLAVGASGTATWERYCLCLPALIIAVAYNQVEIGKAIGKYSCGIYLGESEEVDPPAIRKVLDQLISRPEDIIRMGKNATRLVDGSGTRRVYENIQRVTNGLEIS